MINISKSLEIEIKYGELWNMLGDAINFGIKIDKEKSVQEIEHNMGIFVNNIIANFLLERR